MRKFNIQGYICDKCGKIYNWNKKNGRDLYYCDQGIAILIDKEDYQNDK